jgi:hypothetical protein
LTQPKSLRTVPALEPTTPSRREPFALSVAGRVLVATLSAGAGIIHLVMVPSHMAESSVEGIGFAVAGWIQLCVAVLVFARRSRALLRATVVANLVFIATWIVSRTAGLPFGEHAGHAESVGFVDLTAVGMEAALIVASIALLARPALGGEMRLPTLGFAAVVPVGVLALATAAVASPGARNHALGSHGDHAAGGHANMASDGHDHGSSAAVDDKGLSLLENGHQHDNRVVELDPATNRALAKQLAGTAVLVQKYPTIAHAEADGYRRAGPFAAGLGTHYVHYGKVGSGDGVIEGDDIEKPLLIFDGLEPDSPLAGFMYMALGAQGEPEGFIGPNDHWHYHTNTCIVMRNGNIEAPLGADAEVTQAQCAKYGGSLIKNTGYMVHVWTVPGYESPRGVFSNINPKIKCPDGTYNMVTIDELGWSPTMCKN